MPEETKPEVTKEISKELDVDLTFVDGKIKISGDYEGKGLNAGVFIEANSEYFLRKLAKAIPGKLDDSVIEMLIAASKIA